MSADPSAPRADEAWSDVWEEGWYVPARRCPSPNFGPRPAGVSIDLTVVHSISLPPGVYGGDAIERLFTNRLDWDAHPYFQQIRGLEVSAHFLVRRDGALVQFVSCDARAWHAGRSSWRGRDNCNDYSIGIELEGLEARLSPPHSTGAWRGCCGRWRSAIRWPR
jgi:AmpD protein